MQKYVSLSFDYHFLGISCNKAKWGSRDPWPAGFYTNIFSYQPYFSVKDEYNWMLANCLE